MALSVAERQARRREKLKAKGKTLFQAWVTPAQAARIRALLEGAGVTYHAPAQPVTYHAPAPPRRKRRRPIDPVREQNRALFEAHEIEIRRRLASGQKPSRIVAWLNDLGFIGTGATLNGFLK